MTTCCSVAGVMQACTAPTTRRSMLDGRPQNAANDSMLANRSTRVHSTCCWSRAQHLHAELGLDYVVSGGNRGTDQQAGKHNRQRRSCVRNGRVMSPPKESVAIAKSEASHCGIRVASRVVIATVAGRPGSPEMPDLRAVRCLLGRLFPAFTPVAAWRRRAIPAEGRMRGILR